MERKASEKLYGNHSETAQLLVSDLADRVRVLIAHAEGRESDAWLRDTAESLVDALLELQEWRSGERDPRRQRSLSRALRAYKAHQSGATVDQLRQRFGCSRSTIHRYLARVAGHARRFPCPISVTENSGDER